MVVWLLLIDGHCPLRLVNVICVDLFWLTFIRHFCSHFSMPVRWSCRFLDTVVGSESFATVAVSSTKVLITVYSGGIEIFRTCPDWPWGTPSLLYNGYRVFPWGKERPGRDTHPSPSSSALVMKEYSYTSTPPIGRTACTEPQCLYKGALYLTSYRHTKRRFSQSQLNIRQQGTNTQIFKTLTYISEI